ncbi:MAG: hypothetical protein H8Z69_05335 [Nanohaloarchaea archaeon]|nr:hypothetical protein [Candidatus Nanohaloarchaea archaeon]
METEKIMWISMTVIGVSAIAVAGFLGYTYITNSGTTTGQMGNVEVATVSDALTKVRSTSSFNTLEESTVGEEANISVLEVDSDIISAVTGSISREKIKSALDSENPSEAKGMLALLLSSNEFNATQGFMVIARFGTQSGYVYQLDRRAEIIAEMPGGQATETLKQVYRENDMGLTREIQGSTAERLEARQQEP